jgi:hypothetical protein
VRQIISQLRQQGKIIIWKIFAQQKPQKPMKGGEGFFFKYTDDSRAEGENE